VFEILAFVEKIFDFFNVKWNGMQRTFITSIRCLNMFLTPFTRVIKLLNFDKNLKVSQDQPNQNNKKCRESNNSKIRIFGCFLLVLTN